MKLIEIVRHLHGTLWIPPGYSTDSLENSSSGSALHDGSPLELTEGVPEALAHMEIAKVAPLATAQAGDITFFSNEAYAAYLATTQASVVIVPRRMPQLARLQLVHDAPYRAFALVAQLFLDRKKPAPGILPGAVIDPSAHVDPTSIVMHSVTIGAKAVVGPGVWLFPGVYVGEGVTIGAHTEIRAHAVLEYGVQVGSHCLIHGGAVIGADGFGFAPSPEGHVKIPQVGGVKIGDRVEIGALCTVDRGALEDTVIGSGTKLDSHVHVGHGVVIGEHCLLCAFSGVAGSARLGNWVVTGGHSAINNRCEIADQSQIGGMSALTKSATQKDTYMGFPAVPASQWRRQVAAARRAADLEKKVRHLERLCEKLSQHLTDQPGDHS